MWSYRDPETKMVRQVSKCLGIEIIVNGEKVLKPPVDRKSVMNILDSGPYMLYRIERIMDSSGSTKLHFLASWV